ncbi:RluA family pseudouridine synthase [Alicyclobacillus acidocaldarius]|uniref:RluA family pseudouridine synthase n=1 Tax=Alicyclobacillus acidocaldarius TaxID=405212 RepID=UPI000323872C|nr:RluA family pseudouridine synthase [Alicyclobacillus acidocaldarius]
MLEEYVVPSDLAGRRLSAVLSGRLGMSRRMLRRIIQAGGFYVNGEPVYLSVTVQDGDRVTWERPEEEVAVEPENIPLEICYEDDDVIVVNKPAGMLTHPSPHERRGSLLAAAAHYLRDRGGVPHAVHRLDKYTSGAVLIAKHAHAHHQLDRALRQGLVDRRYVAIVYAPEGCETGRWLTFVDGLAPNPHRPSRRIVVPPDRGDRAVTHALPLVQAGPLALVALVLETGRTHQIRAQMAFHGMPLVGDRDYTYALANRRDPLGQASFYEKAFGRQALHAYALSWPRVEDRAMCKVRARVADDMRELWQTVAGRDDIEAWCDEAQDVEPPGDPIYGPMDA